MTIEKQTYNLPSNFGDNDTINMIVYRLYKFHGQSLRAAEQKAIAWLHPEDYMKAEKAFYNSPHSAMYFPPIGDIKYFPLMNDKVVSTIQAKQGVMEIEGVHKSHGDLVDSFELSLLHSKKSKNIRDGKV